jgi:dihydropteroate synthase
MFWKIKDQKISLQKPLLMGVLNITPDSFSDGNTFLNPSAAISRGLQMIEDGADILDLGGESTRPGAHPVGIEEELHRVLPVLRGIRQLSAIPISIDTTKAEVAKICLEAGANIINDVSGLERSGREMADVISSHDAGLVLMHARGNPSNMQSMTHYQNVVEDVLAELSESRNRAREWGIMDEQIVIDPGLGFAKDTEQNIHLLHSLDRFHVLGLPILLGPSRKSFIGKVTGREARDRDFGTAAVVTFAVLKGIHILRVHEIKPMRDVIAMADALKQAQCSI